MTTRGAICAGTIFGGALTASICRYGKYPSFDAWLNGEGFIIWLTVVAFDAPILLS